MSNYHVPGTSKDSGFWQCSRSLSSLIAVLCGSLLPYGWLSGLSEIRGSEIKSDERVIFFPTATHLSDDGKDWTIPIHGWIFEPEMDDFSRRLLMRQLHEALGLTPESAATPIFDERARNFLVDNERGKQVSIVLGAKTYTLNPSERDGHFTGKLKISNDIMRQFAKDGRVHFRAVTRPGDERHFSGEIHLIEPTGFSVISDIDDTIKVSGVSDKQQLVENTFLKPFQPVEGMSTVCRRWADARAEFHFVSASPWQLYEPLSESMEGAGFPDATFHLKRFRMKDSSFFNLFEEPTKYKLPIVTTLIRNYPQRQFVLVGDSGESDPELYGIVARQFPRQIVRIFVRDVTGEPADSERYERCFEGVPRYKWEIFEKAESLPPTLAVERNTVP